MRQSITYLAPLGSGIGDVIVALPVIEHLVASGVAVALVARGPRQVGFDERISGLKGVVREVDLPAVFQEGDIFINVKDHPIQKNYDWFGEQFAQDYPGYLINDIMNEILKSFGLNVDFSVINPLVAKSVPALAGRVGLVPGTTIDFKSWPVSSWLSLCSALSARGHRLVMFGEPDRSEVVSELQNCGIEWHPTPNIGEAIDAVSSVQAILAVDTGLMHIAVQQGIPTVALMNFVHTYHRPARNCRPLFGYKCAPECAFTLVEGEEFPSTYPEWVWWEGKFKYCKAEKPCMSGITVQQVLEALDEVLAVTNGQH